MQVAFNNEIKNTLLILFQRSNYKIFEKIFNILFTKKGRIPQIKTLAALCINRSNSLGINHVLKEGGGYNAANVPILRDNAKKRRVFRIWYFFLTTLFF